MTAGSFSFRILLTSHLRKQQLVASAMDFQHAQYPRTACENFTGIKCQAVIDAQSSLGYKLLKMGQDSKVT